MEELIMDKTSGQPFMGPQFNISGDEKSIQRQRPTTKRPSQTEKAQTGNGNSLKKVIQSTKAIVGGKREAPLADRYEARSPLREHKASKDPKGTAVSGKVFGSIGSAEQRPISSDTKKITKEYNKLAKNLEGLSESHTLHQMLNFVISNVYNQEVEISVLNEVLAKAKKEIPLAKKIKNISNNSNAGAIKLDEEFKKTIGMAALIFLEQLQKLKITPKDTESIRSKLDELKTLAQIEKAKINPEMETRMLTLFSEAKAEMAKLQKQ